MWTNIATAKTAQLSRSIKLEQLTPAAPGGIDGGLSQWGPYPGQGTHADDCENKWWKVTIDLVITYWSDRCFFFYFLKIKALASYTDLIYVRVIVEDS